MDVRLSQIKNHLDEVGIVEEQLGGDPIVGGISAVEECGPGDLVFVERPALLETALAREPAALVLPRTLRSSVPPTATVGLLVVGNVRLAMALVKRRLGDRDYLDGQWGRVHASAVVHPTAVVPETVVLGPMVVVGQGARLGQRTRVLAGAIIENGVEIGDDCVIHPNAVIGYDCRLGHGVHVGAGSVIGSEGFGFAQDDEGRSHRIPQTGVVVIGDRVRIGAGCCIDRATYGATTVGAGTKFDNLCHVGHNVQIGDDCLLAAMLVVGGSSRLGDRVVASGQIAVSDHVEIASDSVLLHRAGVLRDVTKPGPYAGLPLQPFSQYLRNFVHTTHLGELNQRVRRLEDQRHESPDESEE